jgi:hypothetical protein
MKGVWALVYTSRIPFVLVALLHINKFKKTKGELLLGIIPDKYFSPHCW